MQVQYNILIRPKFDNSISPSVQKECIKSTEGILGEHHVNQFGRVFDGLDKDCDTYYEADFDFFDRHKIGTLDDFVKNFNKKKLFFGSEDQIALEGYIDIFQKFKNLLETRYPKIFFYKSWNRYSTDNIPKQFKIMTPVGLQDTHVHIDQNQGIIRFYMPTKENRYYDYDILKNFAWDASFLLPDLLGKWREENNIMKKSYHIPKQFLQVHKIARYHMKLMKLENIKRIDIDNDYVLPEVELE